MRRIVVAAVVVVWSALVAGSFWWNYHEASQARAAIALQTARAFFDQALIVWSWNAAHGGVYVPVTDATRPNPYLEDPRREIRVDETTTLTRANPAYMTRQIAEIAATRRGIRFHVTSLKPIRPANQATPEEARGLLAFERGAREVGEFGSGAAAGTYFYMAPLIADRSCLRCHAGQGYREGDVRGGISVTLPFAPRIPLWPLAIAHGVIGLTGVAGIVAFGTRLGLTRRSSDSRESMR